jgi:hypothetical protein
MAPKRQSSRGPRSCVEQKKSSVASKKPTCNSNCAPGPPASGAPPLETQVCRRRRGRPPARARAGAPAASAGGAAPPGPGPGDESKRCGQSPRFRGTGSTTGCTHMRLLPGAHECSRLQSDWSGVATLLSASTGHVAFHGLARSSRWEVLVPIKQVRGQVEKRGVEAGARRVEAAGAAGRSAPRRPRTAAAAAAAERAGEGLGGRPGVAARGPAPHCGAGISRPVSALLASIQSVAGKAQHARAPSVGVHAQRPAVGARGARALAGAPRGPRRRRRGR